MLVFRAGQSIECMSEDVSELTTEYAARQIPGALTRLLPCPPDLVDTTVV